MADRKSIVPANRLAEHAVGEILASSENPPQSPAGVGRILVSSDSYYPLSFDDFSLAAGTRGGVCRPNLAILAADDVSRRWSVVGREAGARLTTDH